MTVLKFLSALDQCLEIRIYHGETLMWQGDSYSLEGGNIEDFEIHSFSVEDDKSIEIYI